MLKSWRDSKKAIYREYVSNYFDEYELDVILYPTLKNKVFKYNKTGNISPGSSLGSVIGYPSITVPMGFIGDFSYGIEFLSRAYGEDVLYNVALEYEKINGNLIETSSLTPSLYDVPSNVVNLIDVYEGAMVLSDTSSLLDEWLNDVYNFFVNYNEIENVEDVANELIASYKKINIGEKHFEKNFTTEFLFKYVVILIGCLAVVIIVKEFLRCFK